MYIRTTRSARHNPNELPHPLTTIYVQCESRYTYNTMRYAVHLAIVFAVLTFVNARPFPQFDDGREGLVGRDTVYYGFPFFWYRRPVYDDSDDERDIINGAQISKTKRKPSTVSYVNVGAGWGR